MGEEEQREAPRKPIDRWLWSLAAVIAIVIWGITRTPFTVSAAGAAIFALLWHPVWYFWWVEERLWRRLGGMLLLALATVAFCLTIIPRNPPSFTLTQATVYPLLDVPPTTSTIHLDVSYMNGPYDSHERHLLVAQVFRWSDLSRVKDQYARQTWALLRENQYKINSKSWYPIQANTPDSFEEPVINLPTVSLSKVLNGDQVFYYAFLFQQKNDDTGVEKDVSHCGYTIYGNPSRFICPDEKSL